MMMKKNQSSQRRRSHHDQNDEIDNVDIIEDLIVEILLRVPAISVLRFTSVCKKWYSLILNPDFLLSHSSHQFGKRTDMLVHGFSYPPCPVYEGEHFEFLFLPQDELQPPLLKTFHPLSLFPENHTDGHLAHSCNGLLLLCFEETYYIFNVITKHFFKLPSTSLFLDIIEEEYEVATCIVFDPSVSLTYKVIKWLKHESESPGITHCLLYSSETGSWKLLSRNILIDEDFYFDYRPILLNGIMYWSDLSQPSDFSYCFDVEKESFSFFTLPTKPIGRLYRQRLYFGECGGRLRLIEKYLDSLDYVDPSTLPCSFDIMEMEQGQGQGQEQEQQQHQDGCSQWVVKYHVNMEMVFNRPFLREHPCEVAFIHSYKMKNKGGGGEEEVLLLNINQTSIVTFNLTSNTFGKELTVPNRKTSSSHDFLSFHLFTPTLFPVS